MYFSANGSVLPVNPGKLQHLFYSLQHPVILFFFFLPLFCAIVGSSPHPFCCIVSLAILWAFAVGSV